MNIKDRKLIALVVGVIYIIFLVFVFLIPDLRTDEFVRGITGLLTALLVAIELFILVPSPKGMNVPTALALKVPVALASSAVFYYFLLPQILPFIFPDDNTKTVSGTVYSKEKNERLNNVTIDIQETQLTTKTNADGAFNIKKVPKDKNKLTIRYGGVEHEFDIDKSEKYYFEQILPVEKTPLQKIESSFWKEENNTACNKYKGNNDAVKMFVLKKDRISKAEGYNQLYLKVQYLGEGNIVRTDYNPEMVLISSEPNPALWSMPAENDYLKFAVAFCVGIKKNSKPPTVDDWDSSFWFEKEQ
jgi:hypothetical protein